MLFVGLFGMRGTIGFFYDKVEKDFLWDHCIQLLYVWAKHC